MKRQRSRPRPNLAGRAWCPWRSADCPVCCFAGSLACGRSAGSRGTVCLENPSGTWWACRLGSRRYSRQGCLRYHRGGSDRCVLARYGLAAPPAPQPQPILHCPSRARPVARGSSPLPAEVKQLICESNMRIMSRQYVSGYRLIIHLEPRLGPGMVLDDIR